MPSVTELIELRDTAAEARRDADAAAALAQTLSRGLLALDRIRTRVIRRLDEARAVRDGLQDAANQLPAARSAWKDAEQALTALRAQLADVVERLARLEQEIERARRAGQAPSRAQVQEQRRLHQEQAAIDQQLPPAVDEVSEAQQRIAELEAAASQLPAAQAAVEDAEAALRQSDEHRNRQALAAQAAVDEATRFLASANALDASLARALDQLIAGLRTDVPIALLPVRLETRFQLPPAAAASGELLIRIYPDDVQRDTHEPGLTAEELRWGQHFWRETWKAGTAVLGSPDYSNRRGQELGAWRQLATRFGAPRAAHVAARLTPINGQARPAAANPSGPAVEPLFGSAIPARGSSWTRPALARALPDRWLAIGSRAGAPDHTIWGALIPAVVAVGPDPSATPPLPGAPTPTVPVDPGMRWMVDFAEAERIGMGIRMTLGPEEAAGGFDRLIVLGVKGTLSDPADGAAAFGELIDAHRFTWGCEFVPQGTPTNSTGQVNAGYSRADVGAQRSFALEREDRPGGGAATTDGAAAALALGLAPTRLARLGQADRHDQRDAAAINTALWPVTVGYFLDQLALELVPGMDPAAWRDHFVDHVRARGPLPVLRVGRQPYGLLPVTALDRWQGARADLVAIVLALREVWRASLAAVPGAGRSGDAGRDLVETLGLEPVSSSYSWRWARGPRFFDLFWRLPGQTVDPQSIENAGEQLRDRFRIALQPLGLSDGQATRLARVTFARIAFDWDGPLVQAAPLSESVGLQHNYIRLLVDPGVSLSDVHGETAQLVPVGEPKPLLYTLLRHATLLAYAGQALTAWPFSRTSVTAAPWFEPELVDLERQVGGDVPGDPLKTPTFWRVLQTVPGGATESLGDALRAAGKSVPQPLLGFVASLLRLSDLPSASLARLLSETLDLASHRLDAWITSFATSRLASLRAAQPEGLYLGGYAWLEDVRPRGASALSEGFVHAPSLAQAATAAVLRSGYLEYRDQPEGARLAIDLSSRRVRLAKTLVDGVRQGLPLGGLLGYRFERTLHERDVQLNRVIAPLRQIASLDGRLSATAPADGGDVIAAQRVVDGLKLLALHTEGAFPFADLNLTVSERGAIETALAEMADAVDAIGDVGLAESVHQAVQGNYTRAGASLDAISRGERPADGIDLLATPQTGVGFTQRLAAVMSADIPAAGQWKRTRPRATAEPALNAWAEELLGPPGRVWCQVQFFDPLRRSPEGPPEAVVPIALDAIDVCALDIVYAPAIAEQGQHTELERRLARAAIQQRPAGIASDAIVRLIFERQPDLHGDGQLTFPDLFELARAMRELITNGRALDARDLVQAGAGGDAQSEAPLDRLQAVMPVWNAATDRLRACFEITDDAQIEILTNAPFEIPAASVSRGVSLLDVIRTPDLTRPIDLAALCGALDSPGLEGLDELRDALDAFAAFAVQGAVPRSIGGETPAARDELARQAAQVYAQVMDGVAPRLQAIDGTGVAGTLAKLAVLFGEAFRVLPSFTLAADSTLEAAVTRRVRAGDAGTDAVRPWLHSVATVRDGARRLTAVTTYADVLGAAAPPVFRVAQFPFDDTDRWNAADGPAAVGATSIVMHARVDLAPGTRYAGLLIDEWVETIPRRAVPTALAFHYDAPGARAPQSILLAISPDPAQPWTEAALEAIVADTLELAKLRAVDYDALASLGQLLPAIFVTNNVGGDPAGDTVSSSLGS